MKELFRDTIPGHFLRLVSGGKLFPFPEEEDPSIWKRYVSKEKSGHMAHHGTMEPEKENKDENDEESGEQSSGKDEEKEENHGQDGVGGNMEDFWRRQRLAPWQRQLSRQQSETFQRQLKRQQSEQQQAGNGSLQHSSATRVTRNMNSISGVKIDPEKGKDVAVITWYGDDDPENPQNWSTSKKVFVTFLICLLTFGVYIGSAIYSAGTEGVMERFGVSAVVATLGLTLFVAGYGKFSIQPYPTSGPSLK
jgi:DHA1 family multidrug resistance protein-like MFS transporter